MESVDRQALLDAGLDPDDPQVWATQQRISDLLVCYGIARAAARRSGPRGELRTDQIDEDGATDEGNSRSSIL